jgi:hypothetical protein
MHINGFARRWGEKRHRQCTCNVILRGAFVQPFSQWKSNNYYIFCVCVCSPRYPPCKAPFCHLWPTLLYNIFLHYLIRDTIFGKRTLLNVKYMFRFSLQLLSEKFFILRRNERNMIKNVYWSSGKAPFIRARF